MPDPYPNARYLPTATARGVANASGISLNYAIYAVRNYDFRYPGRGNGQWWYEGRSPDGAALRILVQEDLPANQVILITYY